MRKWIFIIMIFLPGFIQAQQLTLDQSLQIALKNNFDIQLAKNNVEINTIYNDYGIAGGLPQVNGTITDNEQFTNLNQKLSDGTNINRNGALSNNLNSAVAGSILLYNGMRVVSTKKRLETLQSQSELLLNAQIQNTIAQVMTQYFTIIQQQEYLKTIDVSIVASEQQLEIIKNRQSVGLANNADLFQSQIDLNILQQNKQTQLLSINQSKAELLNLLNLKTDSSILIQDTILVDEHIVLENVLNGLQKNPQMQAADLQVAINSFLEKETHADRLPTVRLNSGINYNRSQSNAGFNLLNQSYGPYIGLGITIPIYNGNILKKQEQVAAIDTRTARLQYEQLSASNYAQAVKTYEAYRNALDQLEMADKNYALSGQLLNLVTLKFQLKAATIVDLKLAQQSFETAGFQKVNQSFIAKSAEIELKRLMNELVF